MDSGTEASELDPSDMEERDLWAKLPKKFRAQVGKSEGQLPRDEILGFSGGQRSRSNRTHG